jgi:hypothetical protein
LLYVLCRGGRTLLRDEGKTWGRGGRGGRYTPVGRVKGGRGEESGI